MKNILTFGEVPKMKRNVFLVIFISLVIIVNSGTLILYLMNLLGILERSAYMPAWMVVFSTFICLGNVLCALAAWNWRRWGVVGYASLSILSYIVVAVATQSFNNFFGLVGAIILAILMLPFWKFMKWY